MYPEIGTGPDDPSEEPEPQPKDRPPWYACPGCRWNRRKDDPSHNRVEGICKCPHVAPVVLGCKGCRQYKPDGHHTHTYIPGECKFADTAGRNSGPRKPRKGQHPREPSIPARSTPAQEAQAQLPDGTDLGAGDEEAASVPPPPAPYAADTDDAAPDPSDRPGRGPDHQQRNGAPMPMPPQAMPRPATGHGLTCQHHCAPSGLAHLRL